MIWIILATVFCIYEVVVRKLPTNQNLSFIDFVKRLFDKVQPNYHKDDFPLKKH